MSERIQILELVESGEISVQEAVARLGESPGQREPEETGIRPPVWVRRIWQAVFWSGVALAMGGGLLLTSYYAWEAGTGSLVCGWPFLVLGVLVVTLGAWMERARWFYLRVHKRGSPNVTLALPLPLGLAALVLRIARPFVPQLQDTAIDEAVLALQEGLRSGQPLTVEVHDENGEHVQIHLG